MPESDVLKFMLDNNSSVVIRPGGTEPKLKVYISVSAEDMGEAEKKDQEISSQIERSVR